MEDSIDRESEVFQGLGGGIFVRKGEKILTELLCSDAYPQVDRQEATSSCEPSTSSPFSPSNQRQSWSEILGIPELDSDQLDLLHSLRSEFFP